VAAPPSDKNTPPLSPRALSNDGSDNTNADRLPSPSSPGSGSQGDKGVNFTVNPSAMPNPPAPVKPPRGKLKVRIPEARGIRPSYDPYAVCVFEWNESIARGVMVDHEDTEKDGNMRKDIRLTGVSIKRSPSDMGRSMAIPMKSRQGSTTSLSDHKNFKTSRPLTDPKWEHEAELCAKTLAPFCVPILTGRSDVLGTESDINIYVYDRSDHEAFLGHVKISPNLSEHNTKLEGWYKLQCRNLQEEQVSGEIYLNVHFRKTNKKQYGPEDFQILKLIGRGEMKPFTSPNLI
jgi:protein-serine/threonine kinase